MTEIQRHTQILVILAAMYLHLTGTVLKDILIFRSKPFNYLVDDLRIYMRNLAIVYEKTHSQLLPFHLLVRHAGIIGVEPESFRLQTLDKLLVV